MTLDRSELMKTAWAAAKDRMQRFSYAQRQLRAVFAVELAKAWRNAKRRAHLAQRSVSDITAEIAFLENKSRLGTDGLDRLSVLRRAYSVALDHERNAA
jgi:hypothetical protein